MIVSNLIRLEAKHARSINHQPSFIIGDVPCEVFVSGLAIGNSAACRIVRISTARQRVGAARDHPPQRMGVDVSCGSSIGNATGLSYFSRRQYLHSILYYMAIACSTQYKRHKYQSSWINSISSPRKIRYTMDTAISKWFKAFYATSDDACAHAKYSAFFTHDAKLIMGDTTAVGQSCI